MQIFNKSPCTRGCLLAAIKNFLYKQKFCKRKLLKLQKNIDKICYPLKICALKKLSFFKENLLTVLLLNAETKFSKFYARCINFILRSIFMTMVYDTQDSRESPPSGQARQIIHQKYCLESFK